MHNTFSSERSSPYVVMSRLQQVPKQVFAKMVLAWERVQIATKISEGKNLDFFTKVISLFVSILVKAQITTLKNIGNCAMDIVQWTLGKSIAGSGGAQKPTTNPRRKKIWDVFRESYQPICADFGSSPDYCARMDFHREGSGYYLIYYLRQRSVTSISGTHINITFHG